jgi:hypothetical protein
MKKTLSQKIKIGLYAFSAVVLVFFIALVVKVKMDEAYLLKNGVRVKGAVLFKNERIKSSKRATKHNYEMDLSLFVDTSAPDPAKPKPESFEAKMDALLAASKKRMQNQFREGYAKVTIEVSGDSFQKYSLGEVVDVVHLKDDPGSARLVVDLE